MVRFIIIKNFVGISYYGAIYIPIWLDLLWVFLLTVDNMVSNLHSNMVRFIILNNLEYKIENNQFTFQYG